MGATRNTGYLENLIQYDASDNVAIATSVNPSYKVTLGGSMLGTSAVFSSTVTSSNEFRGLNGYGIRSYTAATATGNNILFAASVFASFDGIYQSSGSTNDFGIWTNGGTINQPKFVIKNGGNVGIGTTSPGLPLDVVINSSTAYSSTSRANVIRAYNINTSANTFAGIELAADGASGAGVVGINGVVTGNGSGAMTFYTRDSSTFGERMRITSGGNVGIGTTSPTDLIHAAAGTAAGLSLQATGTGGSTWRILSTDNAASISGGKLGFNNGSYRMVIDGNGNVGIGTTSPSDFGSTYKTLQVTSTADDAFFLATNATVTSQFRTSGTTGMVGTRSNHDFTFSTNNIERMRITSGGEVGIGTTPTSGNRFWVRGSSTSSSDSSIYAQNSAGTPLLFVRNDGNVGIGTTSPTAILHVEQSIDGSMPIRLRNSFGATSNTNSTVDILSELVSSTNAGQIGSRIRTGKEGDYSSGATRDAYLSFATAENDNLVERMRITSGGNVGINETNPTQRIDVAGNIRVGNQLDNTTRYVGKASTGGTWRNAVVFDSTAAVDYLIFTTHESGQRSGECGRFTPQGYLKASNDGTYLGSTAIYHEFRQTALNDTLVLNAANASFNYSNIVSNITRSTSTAYNHIYALTGSGQVFYVRGDGNVYNANGVFASQSDIKLKENIIDATPKLSDILKVKVRNYNLIGNSEKHIGVIAQELEEIFPNLVEVNQDRDSDGKLLETTTKSVKYSVFVPMLIKAIQELNQKIEVLENR